MVFNAELTPTWFLEPDLRWLDNEIEHVRSMIREAKMLGQESTEQSSESFHDNYNFEESQRQLKMLLNHLGGLSRARERARVVEVIDEPKVVDVGVTVSFQDRKTGHRDTFSIGSYLVSPVLREHDFISYETPVAVALKGLAVGDSATANIGGADREYVVERLESCGPLLKKLAEGESGPDDTSLDGQDAV